ncbi:hypothetical protein DZK27_14290 [Rhodobacteraceae bacterium 63075]|nr:hypothetical protein DZK27_14290 [Rhodobacteraceae bacterium 63075]
MANRPAKVTLTEISRTLRGAVDAGFAVGAYTVNHATGEITVYREGQSPAKASGPDIDQMLGVAHDQT